jgi:hypothetical protein
MFDRSRHDVATDNVKQYFDALTEECRSVPSLFGWSIDETQVETPKRTAMPKVIVAASTKLGTETILEEKITLN